MEDSTSRWLQFPHGCIGIRQPLNQRDTGSIPQQHRPIVILSSKISDWPAHAAIRGGRKRASALPSQISEGPFSCCRRFRAAKPANTKPRTRHSRVSWPGSDPQQRGEKKTWVTRHPRQPARPCPRRAPRSNQNETNAPRPGGLGSRGMPQHVALTGRGVRLLCAKLAPSPTWPAHSPTCRRIAALQVTYRASAVYLGLCSPPPPTSSLVFCSAVFPRATEFGMPSRGCWRARSSSIHPHEIVP